MSFLSDLVEGHFSNLGTDISHAGSSLMSHPSELYETLGGAAALATGGLALGALAPEAGAVAGGGSLFSGLFGGGDAAAAAAGGDAFDIGAATQGSDALMEDCRPILRVGIHADSAQILEGFRLTS